MERVEVETLHILKPTNSFLEGGLSIQLEFENFIYYYSPQSIKPINQ